MKAFAPEEIRKAANVLRGLAADAVQKANSGHPGMPLGMADVAAVLALNHLRASGRDPAWPDRDRLVFSGGHGSALLYALLHELGYGVSLDDLKAFRQLGSKTPGHPERGRTPGVEATTGPLGQGIANGVGMALSQAMAAARFNTPAATLFDHVVWVLCGDGDLEEGISHEACSFAGAHRLPGLVLLYDSNHISIEGATDDTFRDDTRARFRAYGWKVLETDGLDPAAVDKVLRKARRAAAAGPVLVVCRTVIGYGSPNRAGTAKVHGEPLGEEELRLAKQTLGLPPDESFYDPEEVRALFAKRAAAMHRLARKSERARKAALARDPARAALWEALEKKTVPADLAAKLPAFNPAKPVATRAASGKILQALARELPWLVGGAADLAPSNKTWIDAEKAVAPGDFSGRNVHFGIRELAMTAIQNGMLCDGFFVPYTATFAVFSDYMRPAIRIAALSGLRAVYVLTHDSYAVGEDGATHEPVEHLAALRAMPGLDVWRPADATETAAAWAASLRRADGPSALLLSRQNLPVLDRAALAPAELAEKGAYTLLQNGTGVPEAILIASGSEVALALEAARARPARNVRVVSFPCWERFAAQPAAYRDEVLPPACSRRLAVEAGVRLGWERWIGPAGRAVTLDRFGDSAPAGVLAREFGFTAENVLAQLDALLA